MQFTAVFQTKILLFDDNVTNEYFKLLFERKHYWELNSKKLEIKTSTDEKLINGPLYIDFMVKILVFKSLPLSK